MLIFFAQSDFYPVQRAVSNGKVLASLFSATDNKYHAKIRKGMVSTYALSTIVKFEPLIDDTISTFLKELDQRYVDSILPDVECDFGTWLHYFAFDVIGQLCFKTKIGFLENATDVEGIISNTDKIFSYISVVSILESVHFWANTN